MKRYIQRLEDIISRYPDRAAIDDTRRRLTYGGLETESGKIYGYLKKRGIGRENRVLIITERGAGTVSCIIGVLKAGAAFVPLEAGYPQARVDFIKKDTGCVLVIDQVLYEKIMAEEVYVPGFEDTDPHDAAYIIYTSGSTGNPKGVLHEYGNIDQQASVFPDREDWPEHRQGLIAPFYFVAAWLALINNMLQVFTIYVIPHAIIRDYKKLTGYLYDNRIQGIYLPPSYIRLFQDPSPYLEVVMTGSEPANGLYYPGGRPEIRNVYSLSEAGVTVLEGVLDKAWDVAPVGRPVLDELDVHLIDDDGKRIEGPGTGELCFKSEYVRGYVNLPEKTKEAFVNGIYHTGDICRRDESGVYFVCGRRDDMFKINGNRIEPAEIEQRVKEITGLEHVHAKGFREEGRAYIVLYYLIGQAEEKGIYKDGRLTADLSSLADCLPSYMIPSYYVGLEKFPLNANGKLDRQALTPPAKDAFQGEYTAPENELEAFFCGCMQEVLGLEKVGAEDDFYAIGGDSIGVMCLIARCAEGGHEISIGQLYECRTPRRLAAAWNESSGSEDLEALERKGREEGVPLLRGQVFHLLMKEAAPASTTYNLPGLYRLREETDTDRLARAVNRVLRAHSVYMTRLEKIGEGVRQVYDEDMFTPVVPKEMSDGKFEAYRKSLVRPYDTYGKALYRMEIIKTPAAKYLFMEHHHLIIDAMGLRLLKDQIRECYEDENTVLPKDYYYAIAGRESTEDVKKDALLPCAPVLKSDLDGPDTGNAVLTNVIERTGKKPDSLDYILAGTMAAAAYNQSEKAAMFYTYSGRDSAEKNASVGMYALPLPVTVDLSVKASAEERKKMIREQMEYEAAHPGIRWIEGLGDAVRMPEVILFNYQKDTLSGGELANLAEEQVRIETGARQPCGVFTFGVVDNEGSSRLVFYYRYSEGCYRRESIQRFAALFEKAL